MHVSALPDDAFEAAWDARYRDLAEFEQLVDALPDHPVTSYLRARLELSRGRVDEALRLLEDAESQLPEPTLWRARLLETRGNILNGLGLVDIAQQSMAEAHRIYEALGDQLGLVSIRQNQATLGFQSMETAIELFREALVGAEQVGVDGLRSLILLNIELAGRELGMPLTERQELSDQAYELVREGWSVMAVFARCTQIELAVEGGDLERANRYADELPDVAREPSIENRGRIAKSLAALALAEANGERAVEVARAGLDAGVSTTDAADLRRLLGRGYAQQGRFEEAYRAATDAYEQLGEMVADRSRTSARALDVVHRTSMLRLEREREQERADTLEGALTELQEANDRIHELSVRDTVTGLHNRQYLVDVADDLLAGASREWPAEIALIDLDHFKAVNDTFGHAAGDVVLRDFAHRLRDHLPETDVVTRHGGEEFVVVRTARHGGSRRSLCADLRRLRAIIHDEAAEQTRRGAPSTTMSAGVAHVVSTGLDAGLASADRLMYRAKAEGRDRVVCDECRCVPGPADLSSPVARAQGGSTGGGTGPGTERDGAPTGSAVTSP